MTSYTLAAMTSSPGNPLNAGAVVSASEGMDRALMSAALLQSAAAAAEVNALKNSADLRINADDLTDPDSKATAAALRLRTKSHSSSGNKISVYKITDRGMYEYIRMPVSVILYIVAMLLLKLFLDYNDDRDIGS